MCRRARKYAVASSHVENVCPSALTSLSPATSPAAAAGLPFSTVLSVSVGPLGTPWMPTNSMRMTAAAAKFMSGPAAMVTFRFQIAFL